MKLYETSVHTAWEEGKIICVVPRSADDLLEDEIVGGGRGVVEVVHQLTIQNDKSDSVDVESALLRAKGALARSAQNEKRIGAPCRHCWSE